MNIPPLIISSPTQIVLYYYFYMYSTLTDSKLFRRLPYRRLILDNIIRYFHCPLCNIVFHTKAPAFIIFTMYAGVFEVMLTYLRLL